jgi:hypothetical protein
VEVAIGRRLREAGAEQFGQLDGQLRVKRHGQEA